MHPSHITPVKGQPEVWLIPIAVNGELNNPLILIQQHTLLMMIGAMTFLFPGEILAFWWEGGWEGGLGRCDCTALPVLCCSPHYQGVHLGSAPAGTGPWERANPTLVLWQEHWDGQCWSTWPNPGSGWYSQVVEALQERGAPVSFSRGCRARLC